MTDASTDQFADPDDLPGVDPKDRDATRFARTALAAGDPTGWFDQLYGAAGADRAIVPWDRGTAHESFVEWAGARFHGERQNGRALVVGCGYGEDAEAAAALGFVTDAFDVSAAAVDGAHSRHPGSSVRYTTADLFELPDDWAGAFDFVLEVYTVQSLPADLHAAAIDVIASLVAPGGTLLMIAAVASGSAVGPPWPLTRAEIASVPLSPVAIETLGEGRRWRAEYTRPA